MDNDKLQINKIFSDVCSVIENENSKLETLFTLPIDYIKTNISEQGLMDYIKLRQQLIHTLELVEVLVYDTHEDAPKCFMCGNEAKVSVKMINGVEQEYLNGEFTHWIQNGKLIHSFQCDKCIKQN